MTDQLAKKILELADMLECAGDEESIRLQWKTATQNHPAKTVLVIDVRTGGKWVAVACVVRGSEVECRPEENDRHRVDAPHVMTEGVGSLIDAIALRKREAEASHG